MPDIFGVKIIYPKETKDLFHSARIRAMVLNAMKQEAKLAKKDFESTTEHWIHKPQFTTTLKYKGGDVIMKVGLSGTSISNKRWQMVNDGTMRRYVMFDPLYTPKTQFPGSFGTNVPGFPVPSNGSQMGPDGRLHWKIVGRSNRALKGIRPRRWTILAKEYHKIPFKIAIDNAIRRGLRSK